MKRSKNEDFLTEESLGKFLKTYFPNVNWISQFKIPNSRFKVDWFSNELRTCIEFDGYQHYTSSRQIIADVKKDKMCSDLGLKMIRIPYFVQLSKNVIQLLFSLQIPNYCQTFPHGFISKKSTMIFPADFCNLGIERFKKDLKKFSCIKTDIIKSLKDQNKDKYLLLPETLFDLLN